MLVATGIDQLFEHAVTSAKWRAWWRWPPTTTGHYEGAFGKRVLGGDADMTLDTVVWIASMTKAITSLAAMQLVEQGKVTLDEPLGEPTARARQRPGARGLRRGGHPRLRRRARPITLRHLLTHTAGFAYDIWSADMLRYQQTGIPGHRDVASWSR